MAVQFKESFQEIAEDLDWPRYQTLLQQYQAYLLDVSVLDTLLSRVTCQNPDSPVAKANQANLIRDLIFNQGLDCSKSSRWTIFYQTCHKGNLNSVKMLLAAGCNITVQELVTPLLIDEPDHDTINKVIFLMSLEQVNFSPILLDDNSDLTHYQCTLRDRIYRLDLDRLNRAILSRGFDFTSLELPERRFQDDLEYFHSVNLAKVLAELALVELS